MPVVLLAVVPTVVAPENDECVVSVGRIFQSREDSSDLGVGKADGGEVGLDGFFVFSRGGDRFVVLCLGDFFSRGGDVVEVVRLEPGGKPDFIEWVEVEILLRGVPWTVWTEDTAAEEEGFVALEGLKKLDGVVCGFWIVIPVAFGQ